MPNGSDLVLDTFSGNHQAAFQSPIVIPAPNNENQYYIFSLEATVALSQYYLPGIAVGGGRLFYSLLDISLNNGLGDKIGCCLA